MDAPEHCCYVVKTSPIFGRYLEATRDIDIGEIVLVEKPLVEGPGGGDDDEGALTCLSCCRFIDKGAEYSVSRCSRCKFPVCSEKCEIDPRHSDNECVVFLKSKAEFPPPFATTSILNRSVLILRCLLLKVADPPKFQRLIDMDDGAQVRDGYTKCKVADERIFENVRLFLPTVQKEDVTIINGILDTNAHECTLNDQDGFKCKLFPETSLMAHSCSPSAAWGELRNIDTEGSSLMITRSLRPIKNGESITIAYCDNDISLLYGTQRRAQALRLGGIMFVCKCPRCLDQTECNTFLSAIKCQVCEKGSLLPESPTDTFSDWLCTSCSSRQSEDIVEEVVESCEDEAEFPTLTSSDLLEINDILEDEDPSVLRTLVASLKKTIASLVEDRLHENHYILQELHIRILISLKKLMMMEDLTGAEKEDFADRLCHLMCVGRKVMPEQSFYMDFLCQLALVK